MTISVTENRGDDLLHCEQDLSRMSTYFEEFDSTGWPDRFVLRPSAEPSSCKVVRISSSFLSGLLSEPRASSSSVRLKAALTPSQEPATSEAHDASAAAKDVKSKPINTLAYTRRLNLAVLRLIYRILTIFGGETETDVVLAEFLRDVTLLGNRKKFR